MEGEAQDQDKPASGREDNGQKRMNFAGFQKHACFLLTKHCKHLEMGRYGRGSSKVEGKYEEIDFGQAPTNGK